MQQMLMITGKYVLIIGSFRNRLIEVFVDISLSNFNKPHTLSGNMAMFGSWSRESSDMSKLCMA